MHCDLFIKALAAIEPERIMTLDNFQQTSGISSRSVALKVVDYLESHNIGCISRNRIKFSGSDKILAALLAIQLGGDVEHVSAYLSWKDFEKLASEILISFGYHTMNNLRFVKPRMEIDVVGIGPDGFTIAIDCKHWKRSNLSSISLFCKKQAARAKRLIEHDKSISHVVPVVLTLHSESVKFVDAVPLVPIHKFRTFVMDLKGFLSELYVVSAVADSSESELGG